jgi:hypothetical protein
MKDPEPQRGTSSAIIFDHSPGAVFLDRIDRVLRAGLAGIAFGGEHDFRIVLEPHAELACLVLVDFKLVRHRQPPHLTVS